MNERHTPGPWVHHPEDNIITTNDGRRLLEWQARSLDVSKEARDANARLISAAPDLLDAAQGMLSADDGDMAGAWQTLHLAIAKATGSAA